MSETPLPKGSKRALAFIALGTNVGDRTRNLETARASLAALPHSTLVGASTIEETRPIGPIPQPNYFNQMVAIETSLAPEELLDELLRIERQHGRLRGERWGPRTLDLDVVMFGDREVRTDRLTVPHPELPNRDFWQRELAELRGDRR